MRRTTVACRRWSGIASLSKRPYVYASSCQAATASFFWELLLLLCTCCAGLPLLAGGSSPAPAQAPPPHPLLVAFSGPAPPLSTASSTHVAIPTLQVPPSPPLSPSSGSTLVPSNVPLQPSPRASVPEPRLGPKQPDDMPGLTAALVSALVVGEEVPLIIPLIIPSSRLSLSTLSGVGQVAVNQSFALSASLLLVPGKRVDDNTLVLYLNISHQPTGDFTNVAACSSGCSGFRWEAAVPSQGSCTLPADAGTCVVMCHLGPWNTTGGREAVSLQLSLTPLVAAAELKVSGTLWELQEDWGMSLLPLDVSPFSGPQGEPIFAVAALQPVIAPTIGTGRSIMVMAGDQKATVFVCTSKALHFVVLGPGLARCNLTGAIGVQGPGELTNVTEGDALLEFTVVAAPNAALVFWVAAGACNDAHGHASLASEPFPLLVDSVRPSVTVYSMSGPYTQQQLAAIRIQFSEPVTGFSPQGLQVTGGNLTCLTAIDKSHGTYEAFVWAQQHSDTFTFSVGECAALDAAGHCSMASGTVTVAHYDQTPFMVAVMTGTLPLSVVFATLAAVTRPGKGVARLVAYVWHLQFFQMMGRLDVRKDTTLGQILHKLAWINNGWPWPIFGLGATGSTQAAEDASALNLVFPTNGSCRVTDYERTGSVGQGVGTNLQEAFLEQGPSTRTAGLLNISQLEAISEGMHPQVPVMPPVVHDELSHLNDRDDFGAVAVYSLLELAACLVIRGVVLLVLWVMRSCRPDQAAEWEDVPAAIRFPGPEFLVLMLTFPTMAQACMFYATAGFPLGPLISVAVGLAHPLAIVIFSGYLILIKVIWQGKCVYLAERVIPADTMGRDPRSGRGLPQGDRSLHGDPQAMSPSTKEPILLEGSWRDKSGCSTPSSISSYGLLFQDLKGPFPATISKEGSTKSGSHSSRAGSPRAAVARAAGGSGESVGHLTAWDMAASQRGGESLEDASCCGCLPLFARSHDLSASSRRHRVTTGQLQVAYTPLVIFKQLSFAVLTGISARSAPNLGWFQIGFFLLWLPFQMAYLILVQPFSSRLAFAVELIAVSCELGSMGCFLVLRVMDHGRLLGTLGSIILLLLTLVVAASLLSSGWDLQGYIRARWGSVIDHVIPGWAQPVGLATSDVTSRVPSSSPLSSPIASPPGSPHRASGELTLTRHGSWEFATASQLARRASGEKMPQDPFMAFSLGWTASIDSAYNQPPGAWEIRRSSSLTWDRWGGARQGTRAQWGSDAGGFPIVAVESSKGNAAIERGALRAESTRMSAERGGQVSNLHSSSSAMARQLSVDDRLPLSTAYRYAFGMAAEGGRRQESPVRKTAQRSVGNLGLPGERTSTEGASYAVSPGSRDTPTEYVEHRSSPSLERLRTKSRLSVDTGDMVTAWDPPSWSSDPPRGSKEDGPVDRGRLAAWPTRKKQHVPSWSKVFASPPPQGPGVAPQPIPGGQPGWVVDVEHPEVDIPSKPTATRKSVSGWFQKVRRLSHDSKSTGRSKAPSMEYPTGGVPTNGDGRDGRGNSGTTKPGPGMVRRIDGQDHPSSTSLRRDLIAWSAGQAEPPGVGISPGAHQSVAQTFRRQMPVFPGQIPTSLGEIPALEMSSR
eukprot:jgi/Mesvir1/25540/Mv01785-RA.1